MNTITTYDAAIDLLQKEKILLAPSDTVLGLLGICSLASVNQLNQMKQRYDKPYLVLVSSLAEAEQLAIIPDSYRPLLERFWPGPLTVVFKAQPTAPAYMSSDSGSIAVRVPDQPLLQKLLKEVGPLFSTSANLAGEIVPESARDLSVELLQAVDAVFMVEDRAYPQIPSTIIDCTGEQLVIVRHGVIPADQLK